MTSRHPFKAWEKISNANALRWAKPSMLKEQKDGPCSGKEELVCDISLWSVKWVVRSQDSEGLFTV